VLPKWHERLPGNKALKIQRKYHESKYLPVAQLATPELRDLHHKCLPAAGNNCV
jgi:hypothetical protein